MYPYVTCCNIVWASTFPIYLSKIFLQTIIRLATFSKPVAPSPPLFKIPVVDFF